MKSKLFSFLVFAALFATSTSRAGITVYNPPNNLTGGNFTIYYGLGTPAPGKVAYVTVTKPNGSHFTVASADNVSDMSQVCYLYADLSGTYRFFYEYSYYSQGIPQTVVSEVDRTISQNHAPQTTGLSASFYSITPGASATLYGSAYDQDGNMQYLYFYVNPPNLSGWQFIGNTYSPGTSVSGSMGWGTSSGAMHGSWMAQVRALDSNGTWDWNGGSTTYITVKWNQSVSSGATTTYGNQPFTPSDSGGGGSGAWQFVVSGYTNWPGTNGYGTGQSGTLLANNTMSSSWTPPGPGTYQFYVRKLGDSDYYDSAAAGAYYVTVQAQSWDWGTTPSSVPSAQSYTVIANTVNAGGQPYVTLYKNGGYFAAGYYGTQGSTTDTGTQTANYSASFTNYTGNSGSSSRQVSIYIPNYTLTTNVSPAGAGGVTGGGTYASGTNVTVTASANSGYSFTGWSGDLAGSANPTSLTVNANKSVTANFVAVPATPTATAATNLTFSGFTANWNSAGGATSYRLDVSVSSIFSSYVPGYQDLAVGNTTSYSVSGLAGGTTYYYRVRAANVAGASSNSNTIATSTVPAAPTALSAANIQTTSFTANWSTVTGASGYRLDVSTNSGFGSYLSGYQDLNVGNVASTSVTGLVASTTYYYRLRAFGSSGTSPNSNVVAVTTGAGTQADSTNQNQLNSHLPLSP